mgnify:CR=1 FL=1
MQENLRSASSAMMVEEKEQEMVLLEQPTMAGRQTDLAN